MKKILMLAAVMLGLCLSAPSFATGKCCYDVKTKQCVPMKPGERCTISK